MTDNEKRSFHLVFNLALLILISSFEASVWHNLISPIPNPQLWLAVVIFVFLYQSPVESLLIVYIPCFFIFMMTAQPLGFLLLAQTMLFFLVKFVKSRIFVPGQFYFSVIYSCSVLFFHFFIFIFSWIFDVRAITSPQVWQWVLQALVAFLLSPLIYRLLEKINPIDESISSEGDYLR